MELKTDVRTGRNKALRREGRIPVVLYGKKNENHSVSIERAEFEKHLRAIKKGTLATTPFTLKIGKESIRAIVKEIQYHRTTYDIIHLDFMRLEGNVKVNVPILFTGEAKCAGVKLGGEVRQVIRTLAVTCSADAIPECFILDVEELNIGGTKRLRDIALPEGVIPHGKLEEVAVVIAKG